MSSFHITLRACEIPRSVSKTVNNFFYYGLHLRPKKATHTAEIMSVLCVAIFWVVNASSGEKSCLQFLIPTEFGAGGEEDIFLPSMKFSLNYHHQNFIYAIIKKMTVKYLFE